jgi:hypothetical protein
MNPNIQCIPSVDDRRCTAPAEVQEEDRLRLLLQHSTLSPYSLNANFWRAPPLASNQFSTFYEVHGSIYSPRRSVAVGGGICRQEGAAVASKEVRPYLHVRPPL